MTQVSAPREPHKAASTSSSSSHSFSYPQQFERLARVVPYAEALIISAMPRGGLQITQAAHGHESILKPYSRGMHAEDRTSWQTIVTGLPLSGTDAWGKRAFEESRFRQEVMIPSGFAHVAAARIKEVMLPGYDGAIQVYRTAQQGPFSTADLQKLATAARDIEAALAHERKSRGEKVHEPNAKWAHLPRMRQFVFDKEMNELLGGDRLAELDDRLKHQIIQQARQQLQSLDGQAYQADRMLLPDSLSDLWTFRATSYKSYPALADGPVIFFCLQPECCEWALLRPSDLQADAEFARMLPAMKFMRSEFQNGPSLDEIARLAHVSPFHFHRRFTDMIGLTPKHFMLNCQILEAKRQLANGEDGLGTISKSCGFSHQSHFTSRFKQATGLTPTRWRRIVAHSRG